MLRTWLVHCHWLLLVSLLLWKCSRWCILWFIRDSRTTQKQPEQLVSSYFTSVIQTCLVRVQDSLKMTQLRFFMTICTRQGGLTPKLARTEALAKPSDVIMHLPRSSIGGSFKGLHSPASAYFIFQTNVFWNMQFWKSARCDDKKSSLPKVRDHVPSQMSWPRAEHCIYKQGFLYHG